MRVKPMEDTTFVDSEASQPETPRLTYEPPAIVEEERFERQVLMVCGQTPGPCGPRAITAS